MQGRKDFEALYGDNLIGIGGLDGSMKPSFRQLILETPGGLIMNR